MSTNPSFRPKRHQYSNTPRVIQLETTIKCNAKCWFCPQNNSLRQPDYMTEAVWKKIIDDSRGLGATYRPFLLNEPFADKRMPEIVRYIKQDPTAKVEFNTNASMLTPKVSDQLLDAGVDIMRFSIDGLSRETFDESRGISYDRVYKHVHYFLKEVKRRQHPVHTEVRMIKLPGTEEEQQEFAHYWQQEGPSEIIFTDLYSYPWENQTEATNKPCLKTKDEMFFYVDGTATLCCWDAAGRQIIGDIQDNSLLDIWNGEKLKHCRDLLDAGHREQLALCKRCDAYADVDFSDWEGYTPAAPAKARPIIPLVAEEIT
jgi:sulfatase maturation enzyme AslB (radical SAM superfamily)